MSNLERFLAGEIFTVGPGGDQYRYEIVDTGGCITKNDYSEREYFRYYLIVGKVDKNGIQFAVTLFDGQYLVQGSFPFDKLIFQEGGPEI